VAASVERSIRTLEIERAFATPEDALNARQLFDRAVKETRRYDREGAAEGRRLLERVLELEPDHLHGRAAMAALCSLTRQFGFYEDGEEAELIRTGVSSAQRALQLSDADPYATGLAAYALATFGHEIDAMVSLLERTLALSPSFAFTWTWSGS